MRSKIALQPAALPTSTSPSGLHSPSSYGPADSIQGIQFYIVLWPAMFPSGLLENVYLSHVYTLRFNSLSLTGSCSDCRQSLRPRLSGRFMITKNIVLLMKLFTNLGTSRTLVISVRSSTVLTLLLEKITSFFLHGREGALNMANLRLALFMRALIGSFSNDNGDGSENVTIKMNSRFFKRRRDYSNSL